MGNEVDSFSIGNRRIGPGQPVFVIAEVGINHHGDPALCARMMEAAAAAGADAVKLQTIDAEESYVHGTASYNEFRGKELGDDSMAALMLLAERLNLVLFSTPGDFVSLERMVRLGMPAVKISSGLMTNLPLIANAARHHLPPMRWRSRQR
jgi:sialic acid synthase SpsE